MWIEWLAKELGNTLTQRMDQLPKKCKKDVFFYWVNAPTHSAFSKANNNLRVKFNLSLESVIRTYKNMRIIRLKDGWDSKDSTLVVHDKISEPGLSAYWNAVDSMFKFNAEKRQIYLAKISAQKQSENLQLSDVKLKSEMSTHPSETPVTDPMQQFFCKYKMAHRSDRSEDRREFYVENNMYSREDHRNHHINWRTTHTTPAFRRQDSRFWMPRPRNFQN